MGNRWTPALPGFPTSPGFPGFAATDSDAARDPALTGPAPAREPATAARDAATVPPELRAQLDSPDPEEAVRGLARLRALAFSTGNFRLLEQVNVPASSAAAADGRISAGLQESGRVLAGFDILLTCVATEADVGPTQAVVAVTASSPAYQERDAAGVVLAEAAAGPEQRLRLVLAPVGGRWRIQDILPAADTGETGDPGNTKARAAPVPGSSGG